MCKDLIRLSELQKFPIRMGHYDTVHGNEHYIFGVETVIEYAENLPKVDAEPVRHGRWILKAHDKRANYLWTVTAYCSECCDEEKEIWSGYFPNVPDWLARDVALQDAKQVKMSNYCPNCGAKMDLED